jgi:fluoride exporter
MIYNILLVGAGGFIGSAARYVVAWTTAGAGYTKYPAGTFIVNVAGCLAAGLVVGLAERHDWAPGLRLFLAVGFCGGFTTFSSFAVENVLLLQGRDLTALGVYSVLSFALGLGGVILGMYIGRG